MISPLLQEVIDRLEALSVEEQEAMASRVLKDLDCAVKEANGAAKQESIAPTPPTDQSIEYDAHLKLLKERFPNVIGTMTKEEGEEMAAAIADACRRVDDRDW